MTRLFQYSPAESESQATSIIALSCALEEYKIRLTAMQPTAAWLNESSNQVLQLQENLLQQKKYKLFMALYDLINSLKSHKQGRKIVAEMYSDTVLASNLIESLPSKLVLKSLEIQQFAGHERNAVPFVVFGSMALAFSFELLLIGLLLNGMVMGLVISGSVLTAVALIVIIVALTQANIGGQNILGPLHKFNTEMGFVYYNREYRWHAEIPLDYFANREGLGINGLLGAVPAIASATNVFPTPGGPLKPRVLF